MSGSTPRRTLTATDMKRLIFPPIALLLLVVIARPVLRVLTEVAADDPGEVLTCLFAFGWTMFFINWLMGLSFNPPPVLRRKILEDRDPADLVR